MVTLLAELALDIPILDSTADVVDATHEIYKIAGREKAVDTLRNRNRMSETITIGTQ
jgi:hypothetical protein